ncbi:hypothetical protein ACIBVL_18910 [Streptomyces sp. NPDC049687]|uniref:hypothetical protein n=1 Tax=Streptomyces sp. NPDC049687 TaxID=3365596 RepID=UPI0037BD75CB
MNRRLNKRHRTAAATATALLLTGAAGCAGHGKGAAGGDAQRSATQVLTAAYEKTAEARSARITMTMSAPAAMADGGDMKMSGIMGWDPTVMDVTMTGSALAADPDAPERVRMIVRDNVMYMDMGAKAPAEMDGKRWMKFDMAAMAEAAGDEDVRRQMTSGLENMNQDPAEQLAMLLDSPNLKHLGSEKIDGVEAEHYKGTLTVKEMLESGDSLDVLEPDERNKVLKEVEKAGIKGYDTEVWVNDEDLPVRMDVGIDTPEGDIGIRMSFSDYGTKAEVAAPPADETFDLAEMFKGLQDSGFAEDGTGDPALDEEMSGLEKGLDLEGLGAADG